MSLLLALLAPAWGAEVLVPEATPTSMADFSVSYMVYGLVVSAVEKQGLDVDDGDEIREWAGDSADACADVEGCPASLFKKSEARMAIVLAVGQGKKGLGVEARIYAKGDKSPVKVVRETLDGGEEVAFAKSLAKTAKEAYGLLPDGEAEEEEEEEAPKKASTWSSRYGGSGDEDEEPPKKSSSKSSPSSRYDDEEEDEPPKKSSTKSTVSRYDDEDEEERPSKSSTKSSSKYDEDEEEERPSKSSSKSSSKYDED